MQTHTQNARPVLGPRAVSGKHAKSAPRAALPGKTASRILIPALLLGSLAAGTAAAPEFALAMGSMSAHYQTVVGLVVHTPSWMY